MSEVTNRQTLSGGAEVALVKGDITREKVDAIVNAANSQLQHGGGVAAAISRAGGPAIQRESNEIAPVEVGDAKMTTGGDLPAKHVIHTVGPQWGEGDEDNKLESAVRSSLELAAREGLTSIALPAISTGIYGFPVDRAAGIMLKTVRDVLETGEADGLNEVRIVLFDDRTLAEFQQRWEIVTG